MERKKERGRVRKKREGIESREGWGRLIYSKKLWMGRRDGESEEGTRTEPLRQERAEQRGRGGWTSVTNRNN